MPDEDVRTYNARDCVVLHQVKPGLDNDMKHYKIDKVFNKITMPMAPYLIRMTLNGIKISQVRLIKFKMEL